MSLPFRNFSQYLSTNLIQTLSQAKTNNTGYSTKMFIILYTKSYSIMSIFVEHPISSEYDMPVSVNKSPTANIFIYV